MPLLLGKMTPPIIANNPKDVPVTIFVWGAAGQGLLGQGNTIDRSSPVQLGPARNWLSNHMAYAWHGLIAKDKTLWHTGTIFSLNSPVQTETSSWSAMSGHYLARSGIRRDGTLWMHGQNSNGELGLGDSSDRSSWSQVGSQKWMSVAHGYKWTIGVRSNGTLWSWGKASYGMLGDGTGTNRSSPVQLGSRTDWKFVAGTRRNPAAVTQDGTVFVWGGNGSGQLAQNDSVNRSSPTQVGATGAWSSVALGENHIGLIKKDGTLWMCGSRTYGQVGDVTVSSTALSSLVQIGPGTDWTKIAASRSNSIGVKGGKLYTWGRNNLGQIGANTGGTNKSYPYRVGGTADWINCGIYRETAWGTRK